MNEDGRKVLDLFLGSGGIWKELVRSVFSEDRRNLKDRGC